MFQLVFSWQFYGDPNFLSSEIGGGGALILV